jgi:nucleoside diphosphate kinase
MSRNKVQASFFLLKPDCVRRQMVDAVEQRIIDCGFTIVHKSDVRFSAEIIERLYGPFTIQRAPVEFQKLKRDLLVAYYCGGECVFLEVRAAVPDMFEDVFSYSRHVVGTRFYPELCAPGSIRFDFRDKRRDYTWEIVGKSDTFGEIAGEVVFNLIHAPSCSEEYIFQRRTILESLGPFTEVL